MRLLFWDYNKDVTEELKGIFRDSSSNGQRGEEPPDERHTTLNSIEGKINSQNVSASSHGFNFEYLLVDGSKLSEEMQYEEYRTQFANFMKDLNSRDNTSNIGVIFYYSENDTPFMFEGMNSGNLKVPHKKLNNYYRTFHISKEQLKEYFTRDAVHFERILEKAEKDFLAQKVLVPSEK